MSTKFDVYKINEISIFNENEIYNLKCIGNLEVLTELLTKYKYRENVIVDTKTVINGMSITFSAYIPLELRRKIDGAINKNNLKGYGFNSKNVNFSMVASVSDDMTKEEMILIFPLIKEVKNLNLTVDNMDTEVRKAELEFRVGLKDNLEEFMYETLVSENENARDWLYSFDVNLLK